MTTLHRLLMAMVLSLLAALNAHVVTADVQVVREVTIAPKGARAGANIGAVNVSTNISMAEADVVIRLGPLPAGGINELRLSVHGVFVMHNESPKTLALTVGFPVSNSMYSSYRLDHFEVRSNGGSRAVYNRTTGYPHFRRDTHVSGKDPEGHAYPPDDAAAAEHQRLFGMERIGEESFQNLMIWHEVFEPEEIRRIEVAYDIAVPLQRNSITKKMERGAYKGIWPQEANNMPEHFLRTLPSGQHFYFFDYYLMSGGSWKGVIGRQAIRLEMDDSWTGHVLFSQCGPEVLKKREDENGGTRYSFHLRNANPSENVLFALRRP